MARIGGGVESGDQAEIGGGEGAEEIGEEGVASDAGGRDRRGLVDDLTVVLIRKSVDRGGDGAAIHQRLRRLQRSPVAAMACMSRRWAERGRGVCGLPEDNNNDPSAILCARPCVNGVEMSARVAVRRYLPRMRRFGVRDALFPMN
ncbi:hypothetical protein OsI_23282 [Oryza sativa Indica Group]|uniref:Uncharacterized protein n=1 Tax=Oryza sativa subsp. indica TaxID=39946 RepID=A2YDU6_ORYSI|nr:hypothetical protein OsI_23282 [Oryza sativa Indica Group]